MAEDKAGRATIALSEAAGARRMGSPVGEEGSRKHWREAARPKEGMEREEARRAGWRVAVGRSEAARRKRTEKARRGWPTEGNLAGLKERRSAARSTWPASTVVGFYFVSSSSIKKGVKEKVAL